MRLLVCDMDGVLFRGKNFWLDLHHVMGTEDFAIELWHKYGRTDYRKLSELTAKRWKGRDAGPYLDLCQSREVMEGADQLFKYAHLKGLKTAIISSGPWHLAKRAEARWSIDFIFANKLSLTKDNAKFFGSVDVQVDDNTKDITLAALQRSLGIRPSETIVIGDSQADARMAGLSTCSIGYNVGTEVLDGAFDHFADQNLSNVMPHIASCVSRTKIAVTG